jgi:two-component system, sensor histidine kinase
MENKHSKNTILVVEDEPIISLIAVRVLKAEGFDVDVADNGKVAKNMIDKVLHHLYLCDIRTPTMSGMEFYNYLRRLYPGRESRVIFTTGDTLNHEVKAFLSNKDNLFLAKPFTPEELRVVIKKALKIMDK